MQSAASSPSPAGRRSARINGPGEGDSASTFPTLASRMPISEVMAREIRGALRVVERKGQFESAEQPLRHGISRHGAKPNAIHVRI
jgi:hypothetical protein